MVLMMMFAITQCYTSSNYVSFEVKLSQILQFISVGSLGTMGASLRFCIGAQLSNEKKTHKSVDGDSRFNATFTELTTVSKINVPFKMLILYN